MTITLGTYELCSKQERNSEGVPIGPRDLRIEDEPGVEVREFVGADRVRPEHVRCNSGTVSFGVTRTFATPAAALAWATGRSAGQFFAEPSEGELKFGGANPFGTGAVACVKRRSLAVVGCTVAVTYVIQG